MTQQEVDLLLALFVAIAGLAQTVVNIAVKLRQDGHDNDIEGMAKDLKDFAKQLEDCLTSSGKQVQ